MAGATTGVVAADALTTVVLASLASASITLSPLLVVAISAAAMYGFSKAFAEVFDDFVDIGLVLYFGSPLFQTVKDPLILDLDGDGIELTALADSNVHFDYDKDGFSEKTGWVKSDDGILVRDLNANGLVDDAGELFGSPNQDGLAVLETLDTNGDGNIDSADEHFTQLRVWRDLNQNGQTDNGEMITLTEAGIASLSLIRTDVEGANEGHTIGYEALFTRTDGTTGTTQTIYFQTDRQDAESVDNTPEFTAAVGVSKLPQLPGSGQINSIAWKATEDADFREAWTALTDEAAGLSPSELRGR